MAELADAYGSGPYESNFMQVQVLLSAPYRVFITDLNYEYSIFFFHMVHFQNNDVMYRSRFVMSLLFSFSDNTHSL